VTNIQACNTVIQGLMSSKQTVTTVAILILQFLIQLGASGTVRSSGVVLFATFDLSYWVSGYRILSSLNH